MAFLPPVYQQSGAVTARDDRLVLSSLVPTPGKAEGLEVAQALTPGMQVVVNKGSAFVPVTHGPYEGTYHVVNTSSVLVDIEPADITRKRIDKIALQVRDTSFGSYIDNDAHVVVVTGQPATSPAIPTTPPNSIVLGTVTVMPKATAIKNSNIGLVNVEDIARVSYSLAPQAIECTSTSRPTLNLFDGMVIYETDTGITRFRQGSSWMYLAGQKYAGGARENVIASVESGWLVTSANAIVRGGAVQGYVRFTRNGPNIPVGSSGNIGNRHICTIKEPYRPFMYTGASTISNGRGAGGYINASGQLVLANVAPSNNITNDESFSLAWTATMSSSFYAV